MRETDVGWGDERPGLRLPHETAWVQVQPYLATRGYQLRPRYRPDWQPSWPENATILEIMDHEDSVLIHPQGGVLDAVRLSDGAEVLLKRTSSVTQEVSIGLFFSEEHLRSDPGNHCVTILDTFPDPRGDDRVFIVMPLLRTWRNPLPSRVRDYLDMFSQLLEGMAFMHSNLVAHRDAASANIMVDASGMYPEGFHPRSQSYSRDFKPNLKKVVRSKSTTPVKYYFIDFGISTRFNANSASSERLVVGREGRVKTVPELSSTRPYDPFVVDVYVLGDFINRLVTEMQGLDMLAPLVQSMMQDEPQNRPKIIDARAQFQEIQNSLSSVTAHVRVFPRRSRLGTRLVYAGLGYASTLLLTFLIGYVHEQPDPCHVLTAPTAMTRDTRKLAGRFYIKHVKTRNYVALVDEIEHAQLNGVIPPSKQKWIISPIDDDGTRYTIQSCYDNQQRYAGHHHSPQKGDDVCAQSGVDREWPCWTIIPTSDAKPSYTIQVVYADIFWTLADLRHRTPLTFATASGGTSNHWIFEPIDDRLEKIVQDLRDEMSCRAALRELQTSTFPIDQLQTAMIEEGFSVIIKLQATSDCTHLRREATKTLAHVAWSVFAHLLPDLLEWKPVENQCNALSFFIKFTTVDETRAVAFRLNILYHLDRLLTVAPSHAQGLAVELLAAITFLEPVAISAGSLGFASLLQTTTANLPTALDHARQAMDNIKQYAPSTRPMYSIVGHAEGESEVASLAKEVGDHRGPPLASHLHDASRLVAFLASETTDVKLHDAIGDALVNVMSQVSCDTSDSMVVGMLSDLAPLLRKGSETVSRQAARIILVLARHSAGKAAAIESILPNLIWLLASNDPITQSAVAGALINVGTHPNGLQAIMDLRPIPALVRVLDTNRPDLKHSARLLCAVTNSPAAHKEALHRGAVKVLVHLLDHTDVDVCSYAARALGNICTNPDAKIRALEKHATLPLVRLLRNPTAANNAAAALCAITGLKRGRDAAVKDKAIPELCEFLGSLENNGGALENDAAQAVGVIANLVVDPTARSHIDIGRLIRVLCDSSERSATQAARAFWSLLDTTEPLDGEQKEELLNAEQRAEVISGLLKLSTSSDPKARKNAFGAMRKINPNFGDPPAPLTPPQSPLPETSKKGGIKGLFSVSF